MDPSEGERLIRLKHIIGSKKAKPPIPAIISVSHETIYKWIREGRFPPPIKVGRMAFWRLKDVLAAI